MSAHEVRHTIDRYGTNAEFRCTAGDGAECHLTCTEECESWSALFRRGGKWYHADLDECGGVQAEHEMRDYGECLVVEWLDNSDDPYDGPQVDVRAGWSPIDTEWVVCGYSWRYADTDTGSADARLLTAMACLAAWAVLLLLGLWPVVVLWALLGLGLYVGLALTEQRRERAERAFLASASRPGPVRPLTAAEREAWERLKESM